MFGNDIAFIMLCSKEVLLLFLSLLSIHETVVGSIPDSINFFHLLKMLLLEGSERLERLERQLPPAV